MLQKIRVSRTERPEYTDLCPLSMIAGKPVICDDECAHCIPKSISEIAEHSEHLSDSISRIAEYSEYLSCLNYPNDMFGEGAAYNGLSSIASSISEMASMMGDGR